MSKLYKEELFKILERLKNREKFAFCKFADGELAILKQEPIGNLEFRYTPTDENVRYQKALMDSFTYNHEDYDIGIISPDFDVSVFEWMKQTSGRVDENLTFCDIFVNSNYRYYVDHFVSEYKNWDIVLVCNQSADIKKLPFDVKYDFRVGHTAFENDYELIDRLKSFITEHEIQEHLFLFCAGPFGNILTHRLFDFNKNNTYLDIGSTLDPMMGMGNTRGYLSGKNLDKICYWED